MFKNGVFITAAVIFFGGCSAFSPQFNAEETPQFAEMFPKSRNQSAVYAPVSWGAIGGWRKDDLSEALSAFVKSCRKMDSSLSWEKVCREAYSIDADDTVSARLFFETHFQPYEIYGDGNRRESLITGYYLPLLSGSRIKTERFRYPIYKKPSNLVVIDAKAFEINRKNLRAQLLENGRVVPYMARAEIESNDEPLRGNELFWVDDPIGLFFMHIQGSGLIQTENGEIHQIGYAEQNGRPYFAIGAYLYESGRIAKDDLSMQTIRTYLEKNQGEMFEIMHKNQSFIFFEEGNSTLGVFGTQGAPLTEKRSIAVDQSFIPLGSPVFINTDDLSRLTIAQDTGGAIRGAARADFFWGRGKEAEEKAGAMKASGKIWVLLPKEQESE
ncbi:MAG: murein transglycosylase A [Helicobacteraceae bacterium]|nr:murein transglycosylase A [Helicobacteraceae bacterium]